MADGSPPRPTTPNLHRSLLLPQKQQLDLDLLARRQA
jgi:hypothetical protein